MFSLLGRPHLSARLSFASSVTSSSSASSRGTAKYAYLFLCGALTLKSSAGYAFAQRAMASSSSSSSTMAESSQFWNRELSERQAFDAKSPVSKDANIICIGDPDDDANMDLYKMTDRTNDGVKVLAVGNSVESFDIALLQKEQANVLFVSSTPKAGQVVSHLLGELTSIEWIHARSAGIDFIASDALTQWAAPSKSNRLVTNAKGTFSSTLAEYTMLACAYFAKDLPRLMRNKNKANWEKYPVKELRGATLGVVGYGDIGKAAARLAHAYGMKIQALKRRPPSSGETDPIASVVYETSKKGLKSIFSSCDYVLCAMPLTPETQGMIGKDEFDAAKDGAVFINVGRGPIVDEPEMIAALQDGRLKGVGLDVFATEPLPADSPLWNMENVLLSPHNMDMTETFMQEATQFFIEENLPRFVRKEPLLNPVDPAAGY